MSNLDIQVLNGDQAGMTVTLTDGTYRIVRRSAENFDVRSTLVSTNTEQWQLGQEDLELVQANITRHTAQSSLLAMEDFHRRDDIAIWDQRMSQPHAMIMIRGDKAMLVDMGSRNGSYLNGERVGASELVEGDLLRLGTTRMYIHYR